MPQILLSPRNVFVLDFSANPSIIVAGFHQFGLTTNAEFYRALDICFVQPTIGQYQLLSESGTVIESNQTVLPLGNYFVISISAIPILNMLTSIADSIQPVYVVLTQELARGRTRSPAGTSARVCSRLNDWG